MPGPLTGIRIVELAGIGPGPFCGMMLADHGAEVIRVDRPGATPNPRDPLLRGRTAMQLDLKSPDDIAKLRELVKTADGLIEGFRPGVIERLGIGPDVLLADNPKLVIGRMTGWGQDGPYAAAAGHDINYIALSGVLGAIGRAGEKPVPPINLVGDFGGGAMMLAFGMVSGLLAVKNGAPGQVIDCAMTDGSALLMAMMWGFRASGMWTRRAWHQPARYRRAVLRHVRDRRRRVRRDRVDRAAILCAAARQAWAHRRPAVRRAVRPRAMARAEGAADRDLQDQDAATNGAR